MHDNWTGWGKSIPAQEVHLHTDGSHQGHPQPTSSWAVAVGDLWLEDNFGSIPADEQLLRPQDLLGANVFGSAIDGASSTTGIYAAELQAIARALAMTPLSFHLHIHSDSQSSIAAVKRFGDELNERKRLRMQCRTLLLVIHHLLSRRREAGGSAVFHHIRSHTSNTDIRSVGNRLADFRAETCREKKNCMLPLGLQEIPLPLFEPHLRVRDKRLSASGPTGLTRASSRAPAWSSWAAPS